MWADENLKNDYDAFWKSVENLTGKLDSTFCTILWSAHFRMISSLVFIKTDQDLQFACKDIEDSLKYLKLNDSEIVRNIEKSLGIKINGDFHLPFPYRMALKDISSKLQSRSFDINQLSPIKFPQFAQKEEKITSAAPTNFLQSTPINRTLKRKQSSSVPSPPDLSNEDSQGHSKIPRLDFESVDHETKFRKLIKESLIKLTPGPAPDVQNLKFEPIQEKFPKSWKVICPFNQCSVSALVTCNLDMNKLIHSTDDLDEHFKTSHEIVEIIKEPITIDLTEISDVSYNERSTIPYQSVNVKEEKHDKSAVEQAPSLKKPRHASLEKANAAESNNSDDKENNQFAYDSSVKLRAKQIFEELAPHQPFNISRLKVEAVSTEFPKSWKISCPFDNCKSKISAHCYLNNGTSQYSLSNITTHYKRSHQELSQVRFPGESIGTSTDMLIEMNSPAPIPSKSEKPRYKPGPKCKRRPSVSIETLPKTPEEIEKFDFIKSIRGRMKKIFVLNSTHPTLDSDLVEITPVAPSFPKSWIVKCAFVGCSHSDMIYCYLSSTGHLNFHMKNADNHIKREHAKIN